MLAHRLSCRHRLLGGGPSQVGAYGGSHPSCGPVLLVPRLPDRCQILV